MSERLDEVDCKLLAFAAEHRLVLKRQIRTLLRRPDRELDRRLAALTGEGYLRAGRVFRAPHYQIQRPGLVAIDSELPVPGFSLAGYKHDVGLAWLWLAAGRGAFGQLREVLSERRLRSHDGVVKPSDPYGVRLGGRDGYGNQRLHFPDLLLIDGHGRRIALELELSRKGRDRRELILGGYGADGRIDRVVYLVEDHRRGRGIGRLIEQCAREMALSELIQVRRVEPLGLGAYEAHEATHRAPARVQEAAR